jgi:signal transduction histidine kinase
LALAFGGQRRFVASASHELRTPLTIIATELDVTLARPDASADDFRRMSETVRTTVDRSDRLITSLLALALVEEGLEIAATNDLAAVVAESVLRHRSMIDGDELDVSTDLEVAMVVGDPGLLDRLADNLIENAIKHNVAQGWIRLRTTMNDGGATLEIANGGPIVPAASLPDLFEPFRRLGPARRNRQSIGLGLTIVRAIARAHGGDVTVLALADGGLQFTVALPAADATDGAKPDVEG